MTQAENAVLNECVHAFSFHKFQFVDFKRLNKDGCKFLYDSFFAEESGREYNGVIWRNNTGSTNYGGQRFLKFGLPGSPDIIGFTQTGRWLGWEVKEGSNVLTPVQKSFHLVAKHFGCFVGVGNSYAQTEKALIEWGF